MKILLPQRELRVASEIAVSRPQTQVEHEGSLPGLGDRQGPQVAQVDLHLRVEAPRLAATLVGVAQASSRRSLTSEGTLSSR